MGKLSETGKNLNQNNKLAVVLLIALASVSAGFFGGYFGGQANRDISTNRDQQAQIIKDEGNLITQIAREVGPGVVSVNVTSQSTVSTFFGPQSTTQESAGTGFIVSEDGVIVTNRHVIPKSVENVSITLSDGTELTDIEVIGRTAEGDPLDIAFLKIKDKKGKDLQPVKIGDSTKTEVGDRVIAIGNALGQFQNTVTSGIISGYGRNVQAGDSSSSQSVEALQNLFQTDAAINEGNSGGPLVNMQGEVIAVNTAVAGGGAENIGFAIPISDIKGLIKTVLDTGELKRPYLGIRYVSLTDDYAYEYNLNTKRGAYIVPSNDGVASILDDSPAAKAGLQEKDIITKVNDVSVDEKNSLTSVLGRFTVGEKVTLTVIRDNKEMKIDATLEAAPTS
ncbi:trypsin-like peptidase domain-containing protein [Candidatus Saccharibacteria bacterium]|nr:trypsin-like peptidase domain-containing protein [Candidatus Saccharibacteria bacterium]